MLTNQSRDTYKEVLKSIKQEEPSWKPTTMICDTEKCLGEVLMHVFPNAVVAGSWLNYNQVFNIDYQSVYWCSRLPSVQE